ncbi:polysaccharide biosynthesis C-terminal domain-containing protein [Arenibacter sp. GZD96]|uniref:lipopolysaccharide biosynthesis protein n=1 Tax=Aurantibrevibacter litoralis TaxID=3106030 RepID=UPI002AFFD109|nr:polysaccharide biosynthesis C-terminal domain-containing protein [Arenibacter sp. GZD-96]MEA1786447.1 polysaccharide biosynthesis C-terminal domain-containing protein [Arenibacter sp. GZD-96]
MRFFKDILLNNLSQALQFGSRWVLNLALIALLDIESYGVFSFVYSLSNIVLSVLPFGSSIFLIGNTNKNHETTHHLFYSLTIVSVLFFVALLIYFGVTPFFGGIKGWEYIIYGLILSFLLSFNLVVFSYFKGAGKFKKELQAYVIFSVLLFSITGYAFFAQESSLEIGYIFCVLIGLNCITLLYCFLSSPRKALFYLKSNLRTWKTRKLIEAFGLRAYFGLQEIVTAIYTQGGLLILFYVVDARTYGQYRALFVLIAPIFMVTVAVAQVVLTHLKKFRGTGLVVVFRKIQYTVMALGVFICVNLYFLRDYAFTLIKIENDSNVYNAFLLLISIVLMRFIFANYEILLIIYDKQKERFMVMFLAAVMGISSIFLLLPKYGLFGAVLTNAISYLVVLVGMVLISERQIKIKSK